jgi:hypothetical protein
MHIQRWTHLSLLAFFASVSGALLTGCPCSAETHFRTITFEPSSVTATRTPATCGSADPPFTAQDTFALTIVGSDDVAAPYNVLTLDLRGEVITDTQIPLTVPMSSSEDPSGPQIAESTDSSVKFSFALGSDPDEVDDSGVASVVVTIVSMPTDDGQPLSAELDVTFVDGSTLDQTYTAILTTTEVTCPPSP